MESLGHLLPCPVSDYFSCCRALPQTLPSRSNTFVIVIQWGGTMDVKTFPIYHVLDKGLCALCLHRMMSSLISRRQKILKDRIH